MKTVGTWSLVALCMACASLSATAQPHRVFEVSADDLTAPLPLPEQWSFHPTDDPAFAAPGHDASGWALADPRLLPDETSDAWRGIGWFRLAIRVDSALVGRPLGLDFRHYGAAELYLNGTLFHRSGMPSSTGEDEVIDIRYEPVPLVFADTTTHALALRYSNHYTERLHAVGYGAGFEARLGDLQALFTTHTDTVRSITFLQLGLTSLFVAFGLLHLFSFIFYTRLRVNLYFSIVALCIALVAFSNFQESFFFSGPGELIFFRRQWSPLTMLTVLMLLRFIYAIHYEKLPRHYYMLAGLGALVGLWGWINPNLGWLNPAGGRTYAYAAALLLMLEVSRSAIMAMVLRRQGAYFLSPGVLAFVLAFSYPLLVVLGFIPPVAVAQLLAFSFYVILGLLLSISLYLSYTLAQTSKTLHRQLQRVEELTQEKIKHERQLQELEEARQLQLSMLPKQVPHHPHLQLAAYMETAAEVGGDYYDFTTGEDGTLTIAIGDATGHGMKAGTMVTATKSLFNALGRERNLLHIFDRSTRALKQMNLRQLYMALTLARFKEGRLCLTAAGMPPALVYRSETGGMEAVRLAGMPLGSFIEFPYQEQEIILDHGDTVLLMSDGFPELFNERGDMFGYEEVVDVFAAVADRDPQAILQHLVAVCHEWTGGNPPNDDVTFVVMKRKPQEAVLGPVDT